MIITPEQFKKCFPNNKEAGTWSKELNTLLPRYEINTLLRIVAFFAQCGHESNGFTIVRENLNYSAGALLVIWPSRFTPEIAKQYERKPDKIADRVYANRMGNGPEESGDGWKYRGRGLIQLTGKSNYISFAKAIGLKYEEVTSYLETKAGALESACWYWTVNRLNAIADTGDMRKMTKIINGGLNGIEDRLTKYEKIKTILSLDPSGEQYT